MVSAGFNYFPDWCHRGQRVNAMCNLCNPRKQGNTFSLGECLAAASVSSITESLPVQCTEGSAQETQSTLDSTSTPSMQPR